MLLLLLLPLLQSANKCASVFSGPKFVVIAAEAAAVAVAVVVVVVVVTVTAIAEPARCGGASMSAPCLCCSGIHVHTGILQRCARCRERCASLCGDGRASAVGVGVGASASAGAVRAGGGFVLASEHPGQIEVTEFVVEQVAVVVRISPCPC
jgi:hypothetical protein